MSQMSSTGTTHVAAVTAAQLGRGRGCQVSSPACLGPWCCLLAGVCLRSIVQPGLSRMAVGTFQAGKDEKSRLLNLNSITSSTLNYSKQVINPVWIPEVRQQAPSPDRRKCKILWPRFSIYQIIKILKLNHWIYFLMLIFTSCGAESSWFGGI